MLNNNILIGLRKGGKTFQEIGNMFGLSRQRMHQIIGKVSRDVKYNCLFCEKKCSFNSTINNNRKYCYDNLCFKARQKLYYIKQKNNKDLLTDCNV